MVREIALWLTYNYLTNGKSLSLFGATLNNNNNNSNNKNNNNSEDFY